MIKKNDVNREHTVFVRNMINKELVLNLVHKDPDLSVQRIAAIIGISLSVI